MSPEPAFLRPAVVYLVAGAATLLWGVFASLALTHVLGTVVAVFSVAVVVSLTFSAVALACLSWLRRDTKARQERILAEMRELRGLIAVPSPSSVNGGVSPETIELGRRISGRLGVDDL